MRIGTPLDPGTRLQVFSIRTVNGNTIWIRAGYAVVNHDGSINVHLDVLPMDGRLHLRTPSETALPAGGA